MILNSFEFSVANLDCIYTFSDQNSTLCDVDDIAIAISIDYNYDLTFKTIRKLVVISIIIDLFDFHKIVLEFFLFKDIVGKHFNKLSDNELRNSRR